MTWPDVQPDATSPADGRCRATALSDSATITITTAGQGAATATVTGELDLMCATRLTEALCAALDEHPPGVLLDLAEVEFFDCAALRALELARRHAERHGRRLVVERSSAAVDIVLDLLETLEQREAAQRGLARGGLEPGVEPLRDGSPVS